MSWISIWYLMVNIFLLSDAKNLFPFFFFFLPLKNKKFFKKSLIAMLKESIYRIQNEIDIKDFTVLRKRVNRFLFSQIYFSFFFMGKVDCCCERERARISVLEDKK